MPKYSVERMPETKRNIRLKPVFIQEFEDMLANISCREDPEAMRIFFIILYFTGRRPSEIIELKREDFVLSPTDQEKNAIGIYFHTKKGGINSEIWIPKSNKYLFEAYKFAQKNPPNAKIFGSIYRERQKGRKRMGKNKDLPDKINIDNSFHMYYWIKKASKLPPYFFRHNRFTIMKKDGAKLFELKQAKGAATMESIYPYLHTTEAELGEMKRLYTAKKRAITE